MPKSPRGHQPNPAPRALLEARSVALWVVAALGFIVVPNRPAADLPALGWPTENDLLLQNRPERFYMHVDRFFEGQATKPWQGGAFGFTRTPMRFDGQVVETKFHEGIDVRPLWRDATGAPEDRVRAIAAGKVVHVNAVPGRSNYGNYLVIEHPTAGGPFFSLYAHLASAAVEPGSQVERGADIGLLGWTGEGLNRERAHLHLELCLMLHSDFPAWHASYAPGENHHGIHNGLNLVGIDVASIYQQQAGGRVVELPGSLRAQEVAWRAAIPLTARFELATRYPWLCDGPLVDAPSVELAFTRDGQPLSVKPFPSALPGPRLLWVKETSMPTTIFTNRRVTKRGDGYHLTPAGERYLRLIAGDFQAPPVPPPAADTPE